jgi:predicted aspartyl protease
MEGRVAADGTPMITLMMAGQEWPAIIDTGFNGDLELPERLRKSFQARYAGRVTSTLAGGQTIEEDIYLVAFPFDGRTLLVEATFVSGSQILVGTHLLRDYRLQIDFVSKSVLLERAR